MAVTFTLTKASPNADYTDANKRVRVRDVALSGTYTAAGDSLTASAFGLKNIDTFEPQGLLNNGTLAFQCGYDYTNKKLKVYGTNATPGPAVGDPDLTAGTSLTGYSVRVRVVGF